MSRPTSIFADPSVAVFYHCVNCRQLLAFEVDSCPHCREIVDPEQKIMLAAAKALHTMGVSSANSISSFDLAVVLLAVMSAWAWVAEFQLLVVGYVIIGAFVVLGIVRWQRRYGRLPFDDDEFKASCREISRSLRLWVAFSIFAGLVFVSFWF